VSASGDLVLVADVHLGRDDPDLDAFCTFVEERARDTAVLVLLGDVFSLWLGREKFTQTHHRRVLDACAALRAQGVRVVFVEGNREYGARAWEGRAFDEVAEDLVAEPWGGRRWYLAHGDLLNREDRRNRAFRRLVRSSPVLALFALLPRRLGLRSAARLERFLRTRNLRHKTSIPRSRFERYGGWLADRGFDAGVIGHLHVEMSLEVGGPKRPRFVYVLPDWRTARRYLRVPRAGAPRFEAWGPPRPDPPAVVDVTESARRVRVALDRQPGVEVGDRAAIGSGHGPEVRRGRVLAVAGEEGRTLELALEPGPAVQVGDRLVTEDAEGRRA
jgi:UDP-2,3-diacylglucosamine hydrolase